MKTQTSQSSHIILSKRNNGRNEALLLGNEAIVRGAIEAAVGFAASYPGTPSSEIGDTFAEIAKEAGIHFEWSTNEKVALEAAAGAAFCGVRSITFFKHFGLNVASDSVYPLAYYGISGGMVIVVADDPQGWSSGQSEQDTRKMMQTAHLPYLEPSNPQECKDFTKLAFDLSEKFNVPIFIRTTTRVNHSRGIVKLGKIIKGRTKGTFLKGKQFNTMPPQVINVHKKIHEKLDEFGGYNENLPINFIINDVESDFGIITSGVSFCHVVESLERLNLKIPVLKISAWPYPRKKILKFIQNKKKILVVEELESVLEDFTKKFAQEGGINIEINGKNLLPSYGELRIEHIDRAISELFGKIEKPKQAIQPNRVPDRDPILCPGCPHRASFWATREAFGKDCVWGGDIGCYILGIFKPIEMQDFIISMGAGTGISHGISKSTNQKVVSFMGDSTFFHAGIPAIINMVYNKSNATVIILDNRYTAMTGHQPHPGSGFTATKETSPEIQIAEIAKACGANVVVVNPFNLKQTIQTLKEINSKEGVNVVVSRQECRLMFMRRARKENVKVPVFQINEEKCKKCNLCIEFGCPAIHLKLKGKKPVKYYIDESFCWGCSVCAQICPFNAIEVVK